jgi:hypothetical protein
LFTVKLIGAVGRGCRGDFMPPGCSGGFLDLSFLPR